ncbi:MAG: hypothetical protein DI586_08900 [Micavibrio aeruginosavorus]|uniref:Uncharacterized protein n=1 Tax=Micavibrio aeruginosavorus TaxID=349221 RepID=A0A2W5FFL2_9BACT|nr:MAG: hypothetical protein DI586_08900 [Micavibrio aeruginosavorus]
MSDTLHEAFGQMGQTGPNYIHPNADEIIRDAVTLLNEIPEGKILTPLIKDLNIAIRVIIGKEPGFFVPDEKTITLILPKILTAVNPFEIACNLGLAIKEIEINMFNIQRLKVDPQIFNKKLIDIVLEMCKIVSEFEDVHKHTKLVDLLIKLGHSDVYKLYKAKASYQEMANIIIKSN